MQICVHYMFPSRGDLNHIFPLSVFLARTFSCYLIIVVWVKSTPWTLRPGGTDGGRYVKLHTPALRYTAVGTRIRLCPSRRRRLQMGVEMVHSLIFPVCIVRLVAMMVVVVVVLVLMVVLPSVMVRVLHNVLQF